jgi:hypothetical protein
MFIGYLLFLTKKAVLRYGGRSGKYGHLSMMASSIFRRIYVAGFFLRSQNAVGGFGVNHGDGGVSFWSIFENFVMRMINPFL